MNDYVIRNPQEEDAAQIERLDVILNLLFLYHGDLDKRNMFCAVNGDGELVAVAYLMEHDTFHAVRQEGDFVRYLTFEITFAENKEDERIKDALTTALLGRAREIKAQYPDKRIVLANYIDTDNLQELSYYLARGFTIFDTIVVLEKETGSCLTKREPVSLRTGRQMAPDSMLLVLKPPSSAPCRACDTAPGGPSAHHASRSRRCLCSRHT
ncbi:hypothetical protein [Paenibacillus sp. HW567]|uniref:hypothetical protein n=1 Tax=Paenibacillus sp. HW567 TaxID=1034769 RepID=UPI0012EC2C48|nr:hypothetical protein [Paenibacillus sp. HW567]